MIVSFGLPVLYSFCFPITQFWGVMPTHIAQSECAGISLGWIRSRGAGPSLQGPQNRDLMRSWHVTPPDISDRCMPAQRARPLIIS